MRRIQPRERFIYKSQRERLRKVECLAVAVHDSLPALVNEWSVTTYSMMDECHSWSSWKVCRSWDIYCHNHHNVLKLIHLVKYQMHSFRKHFEGWRPQHAQNTIEMILMSSFEVNMEIVFLYNKKSLSLIVPTTWIIEDFASFASIHWRCSLWSILLQVMAVE